MKRSSRLLAVLLAAGMTLSMVACGGQEVSGTETGAAGNATETGAVVDESYYNKEGYPICDEPITITVSGRLNNTKDWDNTDMFKYFAEELGIKTKSTPIETDALTTQYALMLADRSMPDLMIGVHNIDKAQTNADGEAGYWLDLSQYMHLMPNLAKLYEQYPALKQYDFTSDGKLYSINRISEGVNGKASGMIYYYKDMVEAVYPDPIETVDDFYEALVACKEAYPDKIPLGTAFNNVTPAKRVEQILMTSFGINSRSNDYNMYYDADGNLAFGETTEGYRAYLAFMNKLNTEKLMEPDCFVITSDEYKNKCDAGDYIFWSTSGAVGHTTNTVTQDTKEFGVIAALTSEYQPVSTFVYSDGVGTGSRIMVSADTKYPEAICRLIDYICTEEGIVMTQKGFEGVHWEFTKDDKYGIYVANREPYADLVNYANTGQWVQQKVCVYGCFNVIWGGSTVWVDGKTDEELQTMIADPDYGKTPTEMGNIGTAIVELTLRGVENRITNPAPRVFGVDEAKSVATLQADVNNYLTSFRAECISGLKDVNDDQVWENYIKTMNKMGLEKLISYETVAFTRQLATK